MRQIRQLAGAADFAAMAADGGRQTKDERKPFVLRLASYVGWC